MRIVVRLILLSILAILLFSSPATAQEDARQTRYAEWRKIEGTGDQKKLFDTLLNPRNREDFIYGLDYLNQRIVREGAATDGYFTTYGQMLWAAGAKETAGAMAGAALLFIWTDSARCNDNGVGYTRNVNTIQALIRPLAFFEETTENQRNTMFNLALICEERAKKRPPNRGICATGASAIAETLRLMKERGIKPKEVKDEGQMGRTFILPDIPDLKMNFVPDEQWQLKREEIRGNFRQYMTKLAKTAKDHSRQSKGGGQGAGASQTVKPAEKPQAGESKAVVP